jgi:GST-like protein
MCIWKILAHPNLIWCQSSNNNNDAGGKPLAVFESGAILLYLSEKAGGKLLPSDPALKWEALSWLFWQIGG